MYTHIGIICTLIEAIELLHVFGQIWLSTKSLTHYFFNKFLIFFSPYKVEVFHVCLIHYVNSLSNHLKFCRISLVHA